MKLIRAEIKNFRLLKEIELDFSTDSEKPLTVIRAANESGKTTSQYALMWGLWGEKGLPAKYQEFQIVPIDNLNQKVVPEVTIDFMVESEQSIKTYRLNRQFIADKYKPSDRFVVFEVKATGVERLLDGHAWQLIESILPEDLKDIFFTDGDRALSFIEASATTSTKKKRVENAIRALLSLDILETTIGHLKRTVQKFEAEVDNKDYQQLLNENNDKIVFQEGEIIEAKETLDELVPKKNLLEKDEKEIQNKIDEILRQGDKDRLLRERDRIKAELKKLEDGEKSALQALRTLVQNGHLSLALLQIPFQQAQDYLANLKDKKQLPKANIPILEELLAKSRCFCGSDLSKETTEGCQHRAFIEQAIKDSEEADRKTELATSLYFSTTGINVQTAQESWQEEHERASKQYYDILNLLSNKQKELEQKESIINSINDEGLFVYREQLNKIRQDLAKINMEIGKNEAKIEHAEQRLEDLQREKQKIERNLNKEDKATQKIYLTNALHKGFKQILEQLKHEEVKKVSQEMNRIFLEMVGSSADKNEFSSITKAELSENYEILVYGLNNQLINPDQDLNGASRRAITLAFILALTKNAQVEAPNVIDTPLGMMSGYVKQSVLQQMIKEGSQSILFLTHDEIHGVQGLIDQYAGKVYTLTNPAHYPKMLVNKPPVNDARILRCECNHKTYCKICERVNLEGV